MTDRPSFLPNIFKGIALFTPGGDLIYGIDPNKQAQWHSNLCIEMQKIWNLDYSPHFLVPGYTATVEHWLNPQTQQIETIAEAYPPVEQYIPLLQVLFNLEVTTKWHIAPWQEEHCNRAIIETYKSDFPQLWERKDLIIRLDPKHHSLPSINDNRISASQNLTFGSATIDRHSSYVLHLYIDSDRSDTEQTLSRIHQLLERGLNSPYSLKVIDVNQNNQQAAANKILVTPTLMRVSPKPRRRIVGQLDDIQRILKIITSF
ncbi:MAG: circadian clock KaiB family protein [Cyanobacteria bacterium P01_G01_bin.19]